MSDNDWDPSQPPSSDLGATLTLAAIFIGGATVTAAFVGLPTLALTSTTMGSTTSAKIQWQQNKAQVQAAIEEQDKAFKSQDKNND